MQRRVLLASAILLGGTIGAASAQSYDLAKQFSTKINTNKSVWSYRVGDAGGHDGNYALLTNKGTFAVSKHGKSSNLKDWDTPSQPFNVPLFVENKAHGPVTFSSNGEAIAIPGQTVLYHPAFGAPAVVSFLAAAAGNATITYDITHLDWSCGNSGEGRPHQLYRGWRRQSPQLRLHRPGDLDRRGVAKRQKAGGDVPSSQPFRQTITKLSLFQPIPVSKPDP